MQTIKDAELRWDNERGVLYVDDKATGCTVLRICRLASKGFRCRFEPGQMIDLTGPFELATYPQEKPLDAEWAKQYLHRQGDEECR